jgi:hypothetical protein
VAELVELYSKGIKRKLKNYWAAWLPGTRFDVGDIGTLNGYLFEKAGTLAELGIKFYAESASDPSMLDISSESGVSVLLKAAGETNKAFSHIGKGEAGAKIDFGSTGAFIVQAPEVFDSELGDRLNVQAQVVNAFVNKSWEKDWVVITRLVKATSATVLISNSSQASLQLTTKANLSSAGGALGSAAAGITIKYQQGDTIKMIAGKNVTPVFQLSRLKTGFFGKPKLSIKSLRASDPSMVKLSLDLSRADRAILDSLQFDLVGDDELIE